MIGVRRGAGLLVLVALASTSARAAVPDRFAADLTARRARFFNAGARPQAIVPLMGVLTDLWELLDDRAPLVRFLDEATASPKVRADVRGRAVWLRSLVLDRLGKTSDAAAERGKLGLLTSFWVVGPFENEGRTGHAAVYAPERQLARPIDPSIKYDGKERPVSWRQMPPIASQGMISLDAILRPDTNVTGYLTTLVHVPRATRAAVRVGSSGAIKVWVDGALALSRDVYRPVRIDQDAAPVQLHAGWNRVTIKLSALDGAWSLFARLTAPDGAPLRELTTSTELAHFAEVTAGKPARFAVAEPRRELEAYAKAHAKDAQAWRDLGLYLQHVAPDDPEQHTAADALAKAARLAPSPEAYRLLALAQADQNDQLRSLEQGLSLSGNCRVAACAPLYDLLGELYHRARRERRAESLWLDGRAADPDYWPITLELAQLAAERGVPSRAAAMLQTLERAHPALKVLRAEAQLAVRRGRRAEAQALYDKVLDAERDDVDTLRQLFTFARAEGATERALGFVDRIARARPDVLQTALDRADVLESVGKGADAHQALELALAAAPDETRLLERDGRLLHRLGRDKEAIAELEHALAVRPQNPELRAYLHALVPSARGGDLARAWAVDVPKLIARAPKADPQKGDRARVLLDQSVTHVLPNGLSETFEQRVVEILDDRGVREEGQADIRYTPDTQSVEVRAARVYKRSGEVVEATSTTEHDVSEPWYGLYYDVKAQVIDFDALEPGDVIDVEYVVSDVARRNMLADYFGDLHVLQEDVPRLDTRYVLIAPKGKTLYFNQPRLKLDRSEQTRGDETVYTFRATDVPKIQAEPGMPGWTDVGAYVHVSTYKTWSDVAAWYRGLVAEQLQSSPEIHEAVMAAVKGLTDERAKIRAVYDLVVRKTRYVGLEFGIHGYQPYRTTQVFARKFGDCKDKASLLEVMLREIGVDASLVLARTRRGGDLAPEPASLAPFDHAIVYVPKYDLFLDGTAEFSGADELPAQDQDIPVLIVNEGKLKRTPVLPAAKNRVATEQVVTLDASGAARVQEHVTVAGEVAHEWREHYQSPGERLERYDKAWAQKHPGAHVEAVDMPGLDDLERPVEVRATVDVPDWGRPDGDAARELVLPATGREADMQRSYARLSSRRYDLVLGFPWQQEDRVMVVLPAGFGVKRLPEARTVTAPFGKFTLTATDQGGGRVEVVAALEVDRHRIAREDYAAFRRFCAEVDAAMAQDLVIAK